MGNLSQMITIAKRLNRLHKRYRCFLFKNRCTVSNVNENTRQAVDVFFAKLSITMLIWESTLEVDTYT